MAEGNKTIVVSTEEAPRATFVGNTNDLIALISLILALTSLALCFSFSYGVYCLPVIALLFGIVALATGRSSLQPERTRQWGWISVGISSAMVLLVLLLCICMAAIYGAMIVGTLKSAPIPGR